ncbi:hypothetical protein PanWU01x14_235460, partial [Parasponia andersonii]
VILLSFLDCTRKIWKDDIYILHMFGDRHENQNRTVKIFPRFACHRSGVDPDLKWISYMSNLAILDTRNSMKKSVCRFEAPLKSWFFAGDDRGLRIGSRSSGRSSTTP